MVSIIIVNYHVKKELWECINSIYISKSKNAFEIIIVDNDENKNIEEELHKEFPAIKYVPNQNKGFGQGNNMGANHAIGKYLFFLNPDTKIYAGCIDVLVEYLNRHQNTAIASALIMTRYKNPYPLQGARDLTPLRAILSLSFMNKLTRWNKKFQMYWLLDWNKKSILEVESIPGTSFMIRKDVYRKVGGFDERFFLFFEEIDLCKRVRQIGWKIVMCQSAKVYHAWGRSTRKSNRNMKKIFDTSRFYYFQKHFGIIPAFLVHIISSINKYHLILFLIIILGFFLRIYKLNENMSFIGDQGWFYLSARDMILIGKIPLVGITSSHTWLHQGPLWTYIVSIVFWIFNFNPIAPAYFTAALGTFTISLFYKILSEIYSKQAGLIAALLYATSPLVILNDRFAYHTSLIPFFTLILIYFFYKWLNGKIIFFPLIILTLSILYNLELFTTVLWIIFVLFFIYGLIRKEPWFLNLNKKIIFLSLISFLIPMMPVLIYDVNHGFHQTLIFIGWIFYKSISFMGRNHLGNIFPLTDYLWLNYQKLIYPLSPQVSSLLLLGGMGFFIFSLKRKNYFNYFVIVSIFALLISVFINKSPSDAYLPVFFPFLILTVSVFLAWLTKITEINIVIIVFVLIITGFNSVYITVNKFYSSRIFGIAGRIQTVDKIIKLVKNEDFNLIGKGEGSQFKSFTMNYEYLLWWKGYPSSQNQERLKIIVSESSGEIIIEKK